MKPPRRWAIMASHPARDDVRFHCKSGTHQVVTFPTEAAAVLEIRWIDSRRKDGARTGFDGFNLYAIDIDASSLA